MTLRCTDVLLRALQAQLEKEKQEALARLRAELEAAAAKDKAAALASLEVTLRVRASMRLCRVACVGSPASRCPCIAGGVQAARGIHRGGV